jgi:WD40 repeat protein
MDNAENEEEGNEIDEGDAIEVIDLDELMDGQMEEVDGDEEDEDGVRVTSSGSHLAPPTEDNSDKDFEDHGGKSVFCCAMHPKGSYFATGGEDDRAVVRDASTGEVYLDCSDGFKDSVVHVAFSHEGAYFAAADMSGVIRVWKVASKEVVWEFETADITWMSWHPSTNVLFATTADSELWMWKVPSGDSKIFSGRGERAGKDFTN